MKKDKSLLKRIKTKYLVIAVALMGALVIAVPTFFVHGMNISNYTIKVKDKNIQFTGDEIIPKIKLSDGLFTLKEGEDYEISYSDNVEVGTATAKIEGKGKCFGTEEITFDIDKADQSIEGEDSFKKNIEEPFNLKQNVATSLSYKSSDTDIATVDEDGDVVPKAEGELTITVEAEESDSYNPATKKIKVQITETDNQEAVRETMEWARAIAADDSYVYGHGSCPLCHGTAKKYDCIGFVSAAYWHGGETDLMSNNCPHHKGINKTRNAMINSADWRNIGRPGVEGLKAGDILFFHKKGRGSDGSGWYHVELYNGDGTVVGAHTFGGANSISVQPYSRYGKGYDQAFRYVGD